MLGRWRLPNSELHLNSCVVGTVCLGLFTLQQPRSSSTSPALPASRWSGTLCATLRGPQCRKRSSFYWTTGDGSAPERSPVPLAVSSSIHLEQVVTACGCCGSANGGGRPRRSR